MQDVATYMRCTFELTGLFDSNVSNASSVLLAEICNKTTIDTSDMNVC